MAVNMFVYGTLKRGHGNNVLLRRSMFVGPGITKEKFALYESGIPFVVKDEPVSQIHGELYQVPEDSLRAIDGLEGHPDWYCREETTVIVNGQEHQAWLYFYPADQLRKSHVKLNEEGKF